MANTALSEASLAGNVAVVTGGASGIGAACCSRLRRLGATAVAFDTTTVDGVAVDVTDEASIESGVAAVMRQHGRLDVLVHCAGIGAVGSVEVFDADVWRQVLDVNVLGIARVTRAALPALRRSPHPSVVLIGSIAGWAGLPDRAAYGASKGAVHALGLAMAADHLGDGIRVNVVAPGTADTPWVARLLAAAGDSEAERAALEARQPLGRLVTAEEIADAVAYLAGPGASATTGTILAVDGGMLGLRPRR